MPRGSTSPEVDFEIKLVTYSMNRLLVPRSRTTRVLLTGVRLPGIRVFVGRDGGQGSEPR